MTRPPLSVTVPRSLAAALIATCVLLTTGALIGLGVITQSGVEQRSQLDRVTAELGAARAQTADAQGQIRLLLERQALSDAEIRRLGGVVPAPVVVRVDAQPSPTTTHAPTTSTTRPPPPTSTTTSEPCLVQVRGGCVPGQGR